jgi:conjugative relaxase-like TrwC/TraI family protein
VVADIAKLSMGREEYYTRELATDHEAYLSGHGESPGRWYGAGATSLGLEGEASVAGFQAMFEGRYPDTGELLGRPHGRNAVPAFDVVLRPTKSVSILYGLGDPATGRAVLAAHHAGVREAVAYLDGRLGARRGHGGVQHVSGQGLLAVGFDHRTSREGDPLLHTHLVIANRVQGPDGRWTALDGRDLYRHRHQQRRDGWLEANAHLGPQYRQVVRALAWRRRATGVAVEVDRPGYVLQELGPVPESTRGRRAWRQAAAEIEHYRRSYQITDPDRALGPEPHGPARRADRQRVRTAIEWVQAKQRAAERTRDTQSTVERTSQPRPHQQRGRRGPERAAG